MRQEEVESTLGPGYEEPGTSFGMKDKWRVVLYGSGQLGKHVPRKFRHVKRPFNLSVDYDEAGLAGDIRGENLYWRGKPVFVHGSTSDLPAVSSVLGRPASRWNAAEMAEWDLTRRRWISRKNDVLELREVYTNIEDQTEQ